MAKVVFSAIVADARKKVGGNVFTKNRAGAVVRRKVSPVQPRTSAQLQVRASFTALSKSWATLTDSQRAGWNALAAQYPHKDKFGASHTLTGLQMYQKLNRNLATIGLAPISAAPATLSVGFPGALTASAAAGAGTLAITAVVTPPAAAEVPVILAAPQQSPGRTFVGTKNRLLDTTQAAATAPPYAEGSKYVAAHGAMVAGKKLNIQLVYINNLTGAKGIPSSALLTVAA